MQKMQSYPFLAMIVKAHQKEIQIIMLCSFVRFKNYFLRIRRIKNVYSANKITLKGLSFALYKVN